ncbi:hypothetical protein RRG08_025670 [Elysia crispata]|uniref:Uncharacterized protein n=1 Tax=Elysia crispata TaxID=231223 RepID=A0AAE0YS84_9GAST|nr:hypothetical protein RRG08_025670 [Elysia crispata]
MNSVCPRKIRDHDTESPKVKLSGKEKDERQLYKLFQDILHQYQETASIHAFLRVIQLNIKCSTCPFPQEGVCQPHWNQPRSERCELNRCFRRGTAESGTLCSTQTRRADLELRMEIQSCGLQGYFPTCKHFLRQVLHL